ncbi:MAG: S49 family peptidase [Pseudomonadales bacterium]|nr:S49 family peptidase [Pseudomonadales bacterium]
MSEVKPGSSKEWALIESLLNKSVAEQRKSRRWGIFFKLLTFAYIFFALWMFSPSNWLPDKKTDFHTAVIDVDGMIAASQEASADAIVSGLRDAFESKEAKGVILRINSPGGSPVQSGFVFNEILRLKEKYPDKKVYAAITDMGASGAYYIAAAADEIYADPASIVGSIGVISSGFGFSDVMGKVGIDRRIMASGDNKAMLDPFSPVNPEEVEKFQVLLGVVHQQFIDSVRRGRGERLKENKETFSGMFWTGRQALEIGLVDALGSPGYIAREVIGYEEIVDYTVRPNPFDAFAEKLGVSLGKGFAIALGVTPFSLR